jgi:putative ABC transport system ATP-binding protein
VALRPGAGRNGLTESLYVEPEPPAPEEAPALELIDVFKIFRSASVETVALRGLSVEVGRAEMVAVVGPSGSGKSTFLALAGALDTPSAGDVRALGRSLARMDDGELASFRSRIGIVFQAGNLLQSLSALENVAVARRLSRTRMQAPDERALLATLGLEERRNQRPGELSGGEQQRAAVAVAAARRPELVLADEPTGELDRDNEEAVLRALRSLRDELGSAVVVVTHSGRVASSCDRVVRIEDGRVVA